MLTPSCHAGYGLLGMISSFVFRAARNALSNDLEAQERVTGALLAALAIADVRPASGVHYTRTDASFSRS
jgi:hypothetical protein